MLIRPLVVRDAALTACFWGGYLTGLVRGLTPILVGRLNEAAHGLAGSLHGVVHGAALRLVKS
jgi:hypothetical protein